MAKIKYLNLRFHSQSLAVIANANAIIEEYAAAGYSMTLRQLFYRFVSRKLFPAAWVDRAYNIANGLAPDTANTMKSYDKLGKVISDGRKAGLVDWDAIIDHTRELNAPSTWGKPADVVATTAMSFKIDLWARQDYYVEVWFEKEALLSVFQRATDAIRVPFFACRGYPSDSSVWEAAQRLRVQYDYGKKCVVLHFGDHDPSGMDMSRDIVERLELFGAVFDFERLALNISQVQDHALPPDPAKQTDSRFKAYNEEFGNESWELDALEPATLVGMVQDAVEGYTDSDLWDEDVAREERHRKELDAIAKSKWIRTVAFARKHKIKPPKKKKAKKKHGKTKR